MHRADHFTYTRIDVGDNRVAPMATQCAATVTALAFSMKVQDTSGVNPQGAEEEFRKQRYMAKAFPLAG